MSDTASVLGIAPKFIFEGKEYVVSPRTQEHKALFKVWLEANELEGIRRHEGRMTPRMLETAMAGWRGALGTRAYEWGSQLSWKARWDLPGMKYLAYLALKEGQPEVTEELIERMVATDDALTSAQREARVVSKWGELDMILMRLNDPNLLSPALSPEHRAEGQSTMK